MADFVFLVKAQITRKRINLPSSFFMNYARASVRNSLQYFIWLKIKNSKGIFDRFKCKVTFGVTYSI